MTDPAELAPEVLVEVAALALLEEDPLLAEMLPREDWLALGRAALTAISVRLGCESVEGLIKKRGPSNDYVIEQLEVAKKALIDARQETFGVCESLEDESYGWFQAQERAGFTSPPPEPDAAHEWGYRRGQKAAAKGIRNAMGDVFRELIARLDQVEPQAVAIPPHTFGGAREMTDAERSLRDEAFAYADDFMAHAPHERLGELWDQGEELTALRARTKLLEDALRPFAEFASALDDMKRHVRALGGSDDHPLIRVTDGAGREWLLLDEAFRNADAALSGREP